MTSQDKARQTLELIISEAIDKGVATVQIEYASSGELEITEFHGETGFGFVIEDSDVVSEFLDLIITEAKLENKSRGKLTWSHPGKQLTVTVETYDSFGETAFRLKFGKKK